MTPDTPIQILRLWWEEKRLWLRQAPIPTSTGLVWLPDLEIVGLQDDLVRLIAHPHDLDDAPGVISAKLVEPRKLLVIADQPLNGLDDAQLESLFGLVPTWGSPEFFEECRRERVIRPGFQILHHTLPPAQRLVIREQKNDKLRVSADGLQEDFEVLAVYHKLLAISPPGRTFIEASPPIYVVRVISDGLVAATPEEFEEATCLWLADLESPHRRGHNYRAFHSLRPTPLPGLLLEEAPPPQPEPSSPWLGRRLGFYRLEKVLGEGGFSQVLLGQHLDGHAQLAFKIAMPATHNPPLNPLATMVGRPGAWGDNLPDPAWFLAEQASRLMAVHDPGLVQVEELVIREDISYFSMELVAGSSLRELMKLGPVPVSALLRIARTMLRLERIPAFAYHGDLKPDNILISPLGIHLIDPGYFGPERFITTPAYYPKGQPDDLAAFALILWEIAAGKNPLAELPPTQMSGYIPPEPPAPLGDWVVRAWHGEGNWLEVSNALELLIDQDVLFL